MGILGCWVETLGIEVGPPEVVRLREESFSQKLRIFDPKQ